MRVSAVILSGNMHLLLPLCASLLFVSALILVKRANLAGVGPITVLFFANQSSAAVFSFLWFFGGTGREWTYLWQPGLIACLYILGMVFTFLAIQRGDVSIATPVFGVKVVFVALLLTISGLQELPAGVWYAALLASLGIGLIQWTGRHQPQRVLLTLLLAIAAAVCYATFDVLVQRWSPSWGSGRFLPIVYWMVGILALAMIPWVEWDKVRQPEIQRVLFPAALLMAMQAVCIVLAISIFGDAARVNVVYALRGLWGVLLAWAVAKRWGGAEAELPRRVLLFRLTGALMLTAAVAIAVLSS